MRGIFHVFFRFFAVVLLFLIGCSTDSGVAAGGGDDFPNSIEALGKRINENLSRSYDNPAAVSSEPFLDPGVSLDINGAVPSLGKRAANCAVTGCDSSMVNCWSERTLQPYRSHLHRFHNTE